MRKREVMIVGAVMFLFLGSFFLAFGSAGSAAQINVRADVGIRINNDTDFSNLATSEGWHGNGTQGNPYVISGYIIDAQGGGSAIYIGNTSVYFVVENCSIRNLTYRASYFYTGAGIILYNTRNARINNNTIENAYGGVDFPSSSSKITVENNSISNVTGEGIYIDSGYDNIIQNNTISNPGESGIYLLLSNNQLVHNNTILNSGHTGILNRDSYRGTVSDNKIIHAGEHGIFINGGNWNTIKDNTISYPKENGIYLYPAQDNKIYGNTMTGGAIYFGDNENTYTTETITTNNTVNGKPVYYYSNVALHNTSIPSDAGEVILGNVTYVKVESLNINNVSVALQIGYSEHITVENNHLRDIVENGVIVVNTENSTLHGNEIIRASNGIYLWESPNNTVGNDTVSGCINNGIYVYSSGYVTLANNTADNNTNSGIYLYDSDSVVLRNNFLRDNGDYGIDVQNGVNAKLYGNTFTRNGLYVGGYMNTYSTIYIPSSNTVNGKPIYYLANMNMNNASAPSNAGQIILANVSYMNIEGINIQNADLGVYLYFSSHVEIRNSIISNNGFLGVYLSSTKYSKIKNSVINGNEYGVYEYYSSGNVIENNYINGSRLYGYLVDFSSSNTIANNTFYDNDNYGVYLNGAAGFTLYNNSFFFNHGSNGTYNYSTVQAYDNGGNTWNTSEMGNYWYDWANNNASNDANGDGIVDYPYKLDGGAVDQMPLKESSVEIPEISGGWIIAIVFTAALGIAVSRRR